MEYGKELQKCILQVCDWKLKIILNYKRASGRPRPELYNQIIKDECRI